MLLVSLGKNGRITMRWSASWHFQKSSWSLLDIDVDVDIDKALILKLFFETRTEQSKDEEASIHVQRSYQLKTFLNSRI